MKSPFPKIKVFANVSFLLIIFLVPIALSSACSDNQGGSSKVSSQASTSRKIFVANEFGDTISVFDADESGNVAPIRAIRSIRSNTGLSKPQGIFVDSKDNEIFVANSGNSTITVYGRTDTGDVSPIRVIKGENTGLFIPQALFVDTVNDEIFVANFNSITVYGIKDEGDVSPLRTITGDNTELFLPMGIFVDSKNNEIFATSFNPITLEGLILVYPRTAKENTPPKRSIRISEFTDEGFPFFPTSVYVDVENDELFVVDFGIAQLLPGHPRIPFVSFEAFPVQKTFDSRVNVYGRTDEGTATPLRTIRGKNTGLLNPSEVVVATEDNEIFVVNAFNNTVTVYEREDEGDIQPLRTLSILDVSNSGILGGRGMSLAMSVDKDNDELFIANQNNTITVYGMDAKEDEEPLRVIGSNTGLLNPRWLYVDTVNNEIYISNLFNRLIRVHGITDEGNIRPLRTITQGQLSPEGVYVDNENDEIFVANTGMPDAVTVFSRTNDIPLRNITGRNTGLFLPAGIFVDSENDEIFVANSGNNTITIYRRTDEGDVTPIRVINGESTGLAIPFGIFVDTENEEIFVVNSGNDTVTVYRSDASENNDEPIRTINTGLSFPEGIFVDTKNDEIFVTNLGDPSLGEKGKITVYRRQAGEGEEPLKTIEGPDTDLNGPLGISVVESP